LNDCVTVLYARIQGSQNQQGRLVHGRSLGKPGRLLLRVT
jgi:hypothetical protein